MTKNALGICLVLLLGLPSANAQEAPVKLDSAGARAAQEKYLNATRKTAKRYLKDLAREMKRSMKAGDLEEAKQIEAEQLRVAKALEAQVPKKRRRLPVGLPKDQAAALRVWERLPGIKVEVHARSSEVVVDGVELKPGLVVQIVPKPGDKWATSPNARSVDPLTGEDTRGPELGQGEKANLMQLLVWVGDGSKRPVESEKLYEGAGRVRLGACDTVFGDNKGAVWVKVLLGRKPK